ncbi:hypothetical protein DRV85_18565 [Rhodosalinus halophilus]|uniref:STAS domain-containing protein n=1 Tax=Rhodosalinus halophilus TaxID=2259333 RepID=A0A365U3X2_9RHOB|nr:hypothetical protein DRV85_18565 [Rhodosalinus halophilus]
MPDSLSPAAATDRSPELCEEAVVLSGNLSIRDSEELRRRLLKKLTADEPLRIDVGGLATIDTTIIQVLMAARRSAAHQGLPFEIRGVTESPLPAFMAAIGLPTSELDLTQAEALVPVQRRPDAQAESEDIAPGSDNGGTELFWLTEEEMALLRPCFPTRNGMRRVDDRRVLSGIIFVKRNGLRWRDAPEAYGPYKTLYTRWKRWKEMGIFRRITQELASEKSKRALGNSDIPWLQALR